MLNRILATISTILFMCYSNCASSVNNKASCDINLRKKIGQMICLDLRSLNKGTAITRIDRKIRPLIRKLIKEYHIGSFILFKVNLENESQSKKLVSDLKEIAAELEAPPLMLCIDQEGGKVERFSFNRGKLKNNIDIKSCKESYGKGLVIGKELKNLGINCNLAPVVDVNSNPGNPVIGSRSFGSDAHDVARKSVAFMKGLHEHGIAATAKHFPGHGDTSTDSHLSLPIVWKTKYELEKLELIPFKEMIKNGVDIIMTAHIALPRLDSTKVVSRKDGKEIYLPATLSKVILTNLLRKELGFNGIIMTDAMEMKAISEHFGSIDSVVLSINAGADIICMPVNLNDEKQIDEELGKIYDAIDNKIKNGTINKERIDNSYERIIKLKKRIGKSQFLAIS